MDNIVYNKINPLKNISNVYVYIYRVILSFLMFSSLFFVFSCSDNKNFISYKRTDSDPVVVTGIERPDDILKDIKIKNSVFDLSNLTIHLDNFLENQDSPQIRVEGLMGGTSLKLKKDGCSGEVVSSIDQDGVFEGLESYEEYSEIQYYIELNYQGKTECQAIEKSWVHLENISVSYNEEQTALDKRKPQFDVVNLFAGKEVQLSLYENDSCSGEPLSRIVSSSTGSAVVGLEDPLPDLNTHTYYVKQSYKGVSTCSLVGVEYAYSLEVENLSLTYDDVILGGSYGGVVEVAKVLPGSIVSLHKESCNTDPDDSISEDGVLTPATTNSYADVPLYIKYTYDQDSVCSEIDSRYVYLKKAVLNLNSAQTSSHKRTPSFDVSNLYSGKNVAIALYESASCSGSAVSETVNTDTGSATISISSELTDNNTHSYYLKQSYAGVASCSEGIQYTYGLDISDLTISSDSILFGMNPSSIAVSGMIHGSSVSIHKGSCNAEADDSISSDGTLTPTPTNTYTETDLYLKYTLNQGSSCQNIGVSYLNLLPPVLSLNTEQTNLDKRSPKFDVTSLFSGKNVAATIHESSDCSGVAVSELVNSTTGSSTLSLISALSDTSTHSYSVKQSYQGHTSCSNSLNYKYSIDTQNLSVSSSSILYGVNPGSVTVSKMLSESTVSLHKGSCEVPADDSITSDGTLTPISTGSYNYSGLYLKYTKGVESDCDSVGSYYLYLEQPTLSLNSSQTELHPLTPSFNVANLFTGQSVSVELYESSSCEGEPVSASSTSSTGSTILSVSSALTDSDTHSYYVKQTYLDHSTCSASGVEYAFSADSSDLTLTYDPLLYGSNPTGVAVSGMVEGSTVTLHKGNDCSAEADATITEDGTITPLATNTYTESDIYLKYSFDESSSCIKLDTSYIYLQIPSVSLNSSQTALHKRTPSFNVGNLFTGKEVSVALYENSTCMGEAVSELASTNSGSTTLTLGSEIVDNNTHTYYAKQSYAGVSICSLGIEYTYGLDISDLTITSDPILYGGSPSSITVSGMIPGSTLSLLKGSCNAEADETISEDGTLTPTPVNSYIEVDLYLKYTLNQGSSCQSIGVSYLNLVAPVLALNSVQTNLDRRSPKFDVSNLFTGKNVTITIHESSNCSGGAVGATVNSSTGSALMSLSSALTDINSHTYSVKQSYQGHTSCSNSLAYQYSIDTENLGIVADEILYGTTPGSVTISKMLSGSTVSLHKGSCNVEADASITEDGTLTPSSTGSYNYSQIYIKYTKSGSSDCDPIDSYYLYLEQPTLSLNSFQTGTHPLTPTFNVTNLYLGKSVTAKLFEDSSCEGEPVSTLSTSSTGSTTLTLSVALSDTNTHTYYVKQSYLGESICSSGVNYSISVDTSSLTITTTISNGVLNASVSDGYVGSSVSLHKGTCNEASSDSETFTAVDQELDLSVTANSYSYQDVYLNYSFIGQPSCVLLDKKLTYLATPTLALVSPLSDKRIPQFNITGLYSGQTVTVQVYESSNCTGSSVTTSSTTSTGSKTVAKSSALTDISSHIYSAKQTFNGISSCSNSVSYQYQMDTDNLVVVADDLLYGATPGSVSVSNMISGSTVSLHKGACNASADASISFDGSLRPTSTDSYNYSQLYIKYTKGGSTDCDPIDSYYLYLEQPTLALNASQTDTHPLTPTFNVTNLFSGKSVTTQLFENSSCTGDPVSTSSSTSSETTSLTLSSAINDGLVHTYYVKQSYLGRSTCSAGVNYSLPVDTEDLTITISITNGVLNASVSGGYVGSSASLHKGECNVASSDSASFTAVDQELDLSVTTNSYTYQDVYLKYSFIGETSCVLLDKKLTYLATPTLALVSPLSDKRVPQFNITGLYSGKTVTVQVYESSNCTGSTVTSSSTTNTGSKTVAKSSALTDISSHSYSAKQTFNGISSCSNSVSYTYPLDVDSLSVSAAQVLYGSTPGSVSVSGMLTGSTVSLHKGSCGASSDASITSDGNLNPTVTGSYTEQTLYLKYSYSSSNNCKALSSKYLYLETPVVVVDTEETNRYDDTPTFSVTNLFSEKDVNVTLHEVPDCSDSAVSSSVVSYSGSASLTLSSALESAGTYSYYAKQSYSGYFTCSEVVEYKYSPRILEYLSSIPEYNRSKFYRIDQSRGIVIKGTVFGNTVKVYEGDSCNNEEKLLASVTSTYDTTLVHLFDIKDGTHRFSFKELDSSSNFLGCFHTGDVKYKTPSIYRNSGAFSHLVDGAVTTYGNSSYGGDSSSVASSISSGVVSIFSTYIAFAALKENGSVITWGKSSHGGNSSSVDTSLSSGVVSIFSNYYAFAALKEDGSVVTWGYSSYGGDSSSVASSLSSGVVSIFSTDRDFAALKEDGSVVTWGDSSYGGDSSSVASSLTSGVVSLYSTNRAFAALKEDGSVVTWGASSHGGDSSSVATKLASGVVSIFSTAGAFAALKENGSVVTWGSSSAGGNSSSVASRLASGVVSIFSNYCAFVALKKDGSAVTWGNSSYGGNSSSVTSSLSSGVINIFSTKYAFVALKEDSSVVSWGDSSYGGDSSSVASSLSSGVINIFSNKYVFVALKEDDSVVSWGDSSRGGTQGDAARFLDGGISVIYIVGSDDSFMALRADGSIVIWGSYSYTPPPLKIFSNHYAFAALKANGSVVTWGDSTYGGDSSSVASSLTSGVVRIFSTKEGAFAALKEDGSVVTWGNTSYGGDSSSVASRISSGVVSIFSNWMAFAALKEDGSVVTWGTSSYGGDSSSVASKLASGVVRIFSTQRAFAVLKEDGSVVTWGDSTYGGDSSSVASSISSGVVSLYSTNRAFAALKEDGSVVTWGDSTYGGDSSSVASSISSGVVSIFSTYQAFAALKEDGSVVTWGNSGKGGDSSSVASKLTSGVISIFSTNSGAFAAFKEDGSVVTWGDSSYGGDSSSVASKLASGVVSIFSTYQAFAALKEDGSVVTWGDSNSGGDSSSVASSISSGVASIFSTLHAFAALKEDGSVVTWGYSSWGGDSSSVASSISSGVASIFSNWLAFAALKEDGSVVTWGSSTYGGDSTGVDFSF